MNIAIDSMYCLQYWGSIFSGHEVWLHGLDHHAVTSLIRLYCESTLEKATVTTSTSRRLAQQASLASPWMTSPSAQNYARQTASQVKASTKNMVYWYHVAGLVEVPLLG